MRREISMCAGPAASGSFRRRGSTSELWGFQRLHTTLPSVTRTQGRCTSPRSPASTGCACEFQAFAQREDEPMLKDLKRGDVFPNVQLPDENGVMHRLSELQGDDVMVLMLGRGEHCPRERHQQREMLKFYEWCSVAYTQVVTILPNDLHDVHKLKISTGAHWTFLADAELEVQRALG